MKILITGANGQVGREAKHRAAARGHQAIALTSGELDITDNAAIVTTLSQTQVQVVLNAAAYTAVDRAEAEPQRAYAVNRDGVRYLAKACAKQHIPLLHISTDYVFDGSQSMAYRENARVAPLGVYGDSKWQGEEAVREWCSQHIILRTSWVFSSHGNNFVKTMLRLAREREELRVVADQRGCPTFAGAIADTLITLAERLESSHDSAWGTYHYSGTPASNWHEFATAIVTEARQYEALTVRTITAITTAEFPTPAARPANSVLNSAKLQQQFALEPSPWLDGLREVLQMLYTDKAKAK